MRLQDHRTAQIILQKQMLDADTPLRLTAVAASGLVGLVYLSPLQMLIYLGVYFPCDFALIFALRALARRPDSTLRLRVVQVAAFCNMTAFLVPVVMLWLVPGTAPKIGAALFVFGGMLSVMLVRAAFTPMTVANSLPFVGLIFVIGYIDRDMADLREQFFLVASVSLLAAYFMITLHSVLKTHRRLAEARDAALARVATQRRFLATMSHELRTPLNGIFGMAQSLVSSHPGIGAEVIRDSARDMTAMVGDLLDSAAIEAGALRINRAPVDLPEFMARITDRWASAFQAKGLYLQIELSPLVPPRMLLDSLRTMQCISNLLANSLRHTKTGGTIIHLTAHPIGLCVVITDTGPGLSAEVESQLFQPFAAQAAEEPDNGPSTGLGLSICHGLARAMGGELTFERPETGGSRFRLTINAPPAIDVSPLAKTPIAAMRAAAQSGGKRVLVVDDIATNRLVLQLMLSGMGWTVAEAGSGQEALRAVGQSTLAPFDAVLMDIRMPDLSGFETLAQMRKIGLSCPVIAVSADVAPEERAEALAYGFDGYLTKPVEAELLGELMQSLAAPGSLAAQA